MRDHFIKKGNLYYRDNRSGYTEDVLMAGLYTKEEAESAAIVEPWHMEAVPVKAVQEEILLYAERMKSLLDVISA